MSDSARWHTDFHSPGRGLTFAVIKSLHVEESVYQKIEIIDTPDFGTVMLLDGVLMLTTVDEFVYHEMLCHPTLFTHPRPERVLIIGGGDCGTLKRVLSHPGVKQATQVEIDEMVTRVSRKYFPELTASEQDPRASLIFRDGIEYLKQNMAAFDVILVDSTDPVGPAEGLFHTDFYQNCFDSLKPDGMLCIQSESPYIPDLQKVIRKSNQSLRSIFPAVYAYTAAIQTYQAGLWMYQMASKVHDPFAKDVFPRINEYSGELKYYNADIHRACFALPQFAKALIG
ncbi:MAG: polyamine aminopropyltransferase [Candidatus Cloacimonadaceae bacterium]|nr:polyamine aminopropyltransferase [Candidatus Cloacimonadaceae bacterium]MDP3113345.1 polyamine aminopropyltransferase [Candidatus Cloacimonadaceae bacterium]